MLLQYSNYTVGQTKGIFFLISASQRDRQATLWFRVLSCHFSLKSYLKMTQMLTQTENTTCTQRAPAGLRDSRPRHNRQRMSTMQGIPLVLTDVMCWSESLSQLLGGTRSRTATEWQVSNTQNQTLMYMMLNIFYKRKRIKKKHSF